MHEAVRSEDSGGRCKLVTRGDMMGGFWVDGGDPGAVYIKMFSL